MKNNNLPIGGLIFTGLVILAGVWIYSIGKNMLQTKASKPSADRSVLETKVLPAAGIILPIDWGNMGEQMVLAGVINQAEFEKIYTQRGGMSEDVREMMSGKNNGSIVMTAENSSQLLNILWAFGLSNKNEILEAGPMSNSEYGGAGNFASTGGWTLSLGDAMSHYSIHKFMELTASQQKLVERVAKGIYRPCCGNSTYFPDCNHGMAMLGLLELMAANNVSEDEMYRVALQVNSYWFPDTYLTIAKYFASRGMAWENVSAPEVLGNNFSSASGYRRVLSEIEPVEVKSGGGCGV